jgi:hypothetical protein
VPQAAAQSEKVGKVPRLAAQLPDSLLWSMPWFHQIVLMEKVKERATRLLIAAFTEEELLHQLLGFS